MPFDDAGVDEAVAKDSEESAAAGKQAAASAIPDADEPLSVASLNTLGQILGPAIERLTGGQMPAPQIPEYAEDLPAVPVELGQPLLALSGLVQQFAPKLPALKPYTFDAHELMRSNKGLDEMAEVVDGMSRDELVLEAMKKGPGAKPEEEPADTDTDTDPMSEEE